MRLRLLTAFALFMTVTGAVTAPAAHADPKPWYWSWPRSHWENLTWEPYLEDAKHPQVTQWDGKVWEPADWAVQRLNGSAEVIRGFYKANILSRQYLDGDDIPVLEVGPNFYHLSGYDKRRVVRTIDDFYQITTDHPDAMFMVSDWNTHNMIGIYTVNGLQLQ